ncbi:Sarcoplasmic calcium-binding protein [Chionoecetes opilio]|uniref:Sarcoplasmic calcium-binding protein n=1 Tax=Chionoecetes opilio TaxID=41210 RepID=A0A8J4Y0I3_CHIOP|nr:Sarcoplasmic calcium-binding protein [Chionoecetes opilio]
MSLSRCVASALRTRHVLQRTVLPVVARAGVIKGNEVGLQPAACLAPLQIHGQAGAARYYSKRARAQRRSSSSSDSSDSDRGSGSGKRGKHGLTPFWRLKMRTHHEVLDINKDGVVSWDDFETLIKNFTELGHLSSDEVASFTDAVRHVWEEEWGASGDPYVFIGQEQFLLQMEHVAVDRDGSGEISIEEFKMFYACLGLSEEAAAQSFAAIDLNGDGRLTRKEFVKLGREFFLSVDESRPSKLFWGPLSD